MTGHGMIGNMSENHLDSSCAESRQNLRPLARRRGHDVEAGADADVHGGGPSFFSIRSMAVFLTSFGAVGAIANRYMKVESALISSLLGIMGGVIMSGVYLLAMRMIYSQQASSLIEDRDLVGVEGRVTVAIPENGIGEVSCAIAAQGARRMARARQEIGRAHV